MPDQIFESARLVSVYDAFDGSRSDLEHYLAIVNELGVRTVLDVGCGTGCFASTLSSHGFEVIALDPAQASLACARQKPNTERVHWILGDASCAPAQCADVAVMTGNVAQVFLTDDAWIDNLRAIHRALRPSGHIVFEARDPARQAWLGWTREHTYKRIEVPDIGAVEGWCELTSVAQELVSFRWTYCFESDGQALVSDSTLRFRTKEQIVDSLEDTGFALIEVRDAPDRPKQEFVFIAQAIK